MTLYNKSDMAYDDYKWTAYPSDNPKVTGYPDNTLFNRHEGYEVLYFINKMANIHSLATKVECKKMELMIRGYLPSDVRSQAHVKKWIEDNWNRYNLN